MRNKLLSLLILVVTFWAIYGFYYYFFVLNKWNLTLNWNVENYTVSLYNNELKINFLTNCKNTKCELIDLAPFDYEISISKEGYKTWTQSLKIQPKTTKEINFDLKKQLLIKKISEETGLSSRPVSDIDKFREIASIQKDSYMFFDEDNLGFFYFLENNDNTITLINKLNGKENKIYTFKKAEKVNIDLQKVYGSDNVIFIWVWDEKYIYDILKNDISEIFFPQKVNYVKRNWDIYSFACDKWTFLYDSTNKKIEYFYFFKDFIFYDDFNYFWIIFDDEKEKKKNYNLDKQDWNLIVKYNFKTKSIKVLEKTDMNIIKITKENDKVYFYDEFDNKYLVENI